MIGALRANFSSSAVYGCTSGRPVLLARIFQPSIPSKTRTAFWPSTVISNRVRSGRFCSSTNGTRPPRFAPSTRPAQAMASILRQASKPPRAAAFLSRIWSAVRVCAVAGSAANAAAAADAARAQAAKRLIDMAGWRLPRGLLELRLGEQGVVQRRIDLDRLDRHLVRALDAFDHGLHHVRELQPAHRLEIAGEDGHLAHAPVEAARLAVDLRLEEALRIDPQVDLLAALQRQLELVGVPAFDDLRARELDLRSLPLEVDKRAVEIGRRRGRPGLGRGVVLDLVAVEVGPHLPALIAVPYLHRRLLLELDLQAALLRAVHAHHEGQLRVLLAAGVHLARHRQAVHRAPCRQAAAGRDVPVDDPGHR